MGDGCQVGGWMTSTTNGGGQTMMAMNTPYDTTVSANTGDCDDKVVEHLFHLMYIVVSKYSTTPRLVETEYPIGLVYNWFKSVGLQQLDRFELVVRGSVRFFEIEGAVRTSCGCGCT